MKKLIQWCPLLVLGSPIANAQQEGNTDELKFRFDAGINYVSTRHHEKINDPIPSYGDFETAMMLGLAVEQAIDDKQSYGTKLELHRIDGNLLTTLRAIDYKYRLDNNWQVGGFLGAASYDFRTTSFGYTAGLGLFYQPADWNNLGVSIEAQYVDKLARDKLHEDDVKGDNVGPDSFIDMQAIVFAVTYSF